MRGAVLVAIAASIGNFLQGWDNATIAGAIIYIKSELDLTTTVEGLVVAMSLIGATIITTCSGAISDWIGRRPMLITSSVLYFVSGLLMLWSPSVFMLCVARLMDGFGIGLAVTLVPLYISETAPSDIRGSLNTLPQFSGSGGLFLAYCMVFGMSLSESPSWRLMLGVLSIPSMLYFVLAVFFLPESPRWLVSKGRMVEAKKVLQRIRGREDVSGEMALLVEGLGIGGETSIEEYIIREEDEVEDGDVAEKDNIRLYGLEAGMSWVAKPVNGQSSVVGVGAASRQGSIVSKSMGQLIDPVVTLFRSVHEKTLDTGSMLFPNFRSMFSTIDDGVKKPDWDEESLQREGEASEGDSNDNLQSPLILQQTTSLEKDMGSHPFQSRGSKIARRQSSLIEGTEGGIGGGWHLAWKLSEDERNEGTLKRVYLHEEAGGLAASRRGSVISIGKYSDKSSMFHPSQTVSNAPPWNALLEPGVRHALLVGIAIQLLQQQFSGINGVLYYTPQILEEAGVEVLLEDLGISSDSASFLISALITLLMLPCIALAMKLMDISGRRQLLLTTIPVLIVAMMIFVITNLLDSGSVEHAVISTVCVVVYFCVFVMAYGPIPNILCAEIFPTRVRGLCIAICAMVFWIGDIIVTDTLPVLLDSIGLSGIFGIYALVCFISWIFVFFKVPETKGMPLEVITEFFAFGATQAAASAKNH